MLLEVWMVECSMIKRWGGCAYVWECQMNHIHTKPWPQIQSNGIRQASAGEAKLLFISIRDMSRSDPTQCSRPNSAHFIFMSEKYNTATHKHSTRAAPRGLLSLMMDNILGLCLKIWLTCVCLWEKGGKQRDLSFCLCRWSVYSDWVCIYISGWFLCVCVWSACSKWALMATEVELDVQQ